MNLLRGVQSLQREDKIKGALRFFILLIGGYYIVSMLLNGNNFDILDLGLFINTVGTAAILRWIYKFIATLELKDLILISVAAVLFSIYLTLRNLELKSIWMKKLKSLF